MQHGARQDPNLPRDFTKRHAIDLSSRVWSALPQFFLHHCISEMRRSTVCPTLVIVVGHEVCVCSPVCWTIIASVKWTKLSMERIWGSTYWAFPPATRNTTASTISC